MPWYSTVLFVWLSLSRHTSAPTAACLNPPLPSAPTVTVCFAAYTHTCNHKARWWACSVVPVFHVSSVRCCWSRSTSESLLSCPTPSPYSAAPQWLYKIFISILIVFFHFLSSEVNAVMSDYSRSHAMLHSCYSPKAPAPRHISV